MGIELDEVYLPSSQTVYAQWGISSSYTKWGTVGWRITDDGILKIRPWEGDTGTTGSVTSYSGAPWYWQASKIKKVESTGTIVLNANSVGLFYKCSSLTDLTPLADWNVSNVKNMLYMFQRCSSLTDLTGLAGWTVSKVASMSITDDGILKIRPWEGDTGTTGSTLNGYSTIPWYNQASKIKKVESTGTIVLNASSTYLFYNCSNLTDLTGLASWNVSNVKNMSYMFYNCSSLTDLNALASWSMSNVTNMESMFNGCSSLTNLTALAHWNVSNVTSMYLTFAGCSILTDLTPLKRWNVSNVTSMGSMFSGCSKLTNLNALTNWNVSNVCSKLTNLNALTNWNVSNVASMRYMFQNCSKLTNLTPLEHWDVSNVKDMRSMFYVCSSLTDLTPLESWIVLSSLT